MIGYLQDDLITLREATELLGVHPNTLRRLCDKGQIPVVRVNSRGDRRFKREDIQCYLDNLNGEYFGPKIDMSNDARRLPDSDRSEVILDGSENTPKGPVSPIPEAPDEIDGPLPERETARIAQETRIAAANCHNPEYSLSPIPVDDYFDLGWDDIITHLKKHPIKILQYDFCLLAGYVMQKKSEDNSFTARQVVEFLNQKGVKLSNPRLFLKLLTRSNLVEKIEDNAKSNRLRISSRGERRIGMLMEVR